MHSYGIVVIGDELLSGKRQDKHLPFVIAALQRRGLELHWVRIVGDAPALLTQTFRETFASGAVVFSFGGIGGTPDDITRQCAAAACGLSIERHPEVVEILEEKFGEKAYPNRIRMAELPVGARLIPNPVNQIPGFSLGDHHFVPGFPDMAHPMLEWVLDTRYHAQFGSYASVEARLCVLDAPESELIPLQEAVLWAFPGVRLSSLPSGGNRRRVEIGLRGEPALVEAARERLIVELTAAGMAFAMLD
ncbi:MAG: competence/damage-inducible protein A [Thiotrichales bacterium]